MKLAIYSLIPVSLLNSTRDPTVKLTPTPNFLNAPDCLLGHQNNTNTLAFIPCLKFSANPEGWVIGSNNELNVTDNNNNLTNSSLVTSFYQSNTKANVGGNSTNVTVQGTGSLTHAAIFEFRTTNTSNFTDAYRIVKIDIVALDLTNSDTSVTPRADSETLKVVERCITVDNSSGVDGGYGSSYQDCTYNGTNTAQDIILMQIGNA